MKEGTGVTAHKLAAVLVIAALASLVVASICPLTLAASGWSKTYGGQGHDAGTGNTFQTSDGGFAVSGDTNSSGAGGMDFLLFKTDATGNMLWSKTYGGALDEVCGDMCQAGDGGFVLSGNTRSFGAGGLDVYVVKTDAVGNIQWSKTYGGAGDEYMINVIRTSDDGYMMSGYTTSFGAGNRDAWLIKTDANGNMQWNKTYGVATEDIAYGLVQTSDGGYTFTGRTNTSAAGGFDVWLVRADAGGNMQWNKTYGGNSADYAYAIAQTSDGGYAMGGYTASFGGVRAYLIRTDAGGNMQWNKTYGAGTPAQIALHMMKTADEGFAMVGWNYVNGQDLLLIKTDSAGNQQFSTSYGGPGVENGYALLQTSDGGYVLTGNTASYSAGIGSDAWLIKTDANGLLPVDPNAPAANAFSSVSVLRGWTWYFFAHNNGGTAPYTYQWYEGAVPMAGQTSMVLSVTKTTTGTFTFYCKVTDAQGRTVTSNGVTMTVIG